MAPIACTQPRKAAHYNSFLQHQKPQHQQQRQRRQPSKAAHYNSILQRQPPASAAVPACSMQHAATSTRAPDSQALGLATAT